MIFEALLYTTARTTPPLRRLGLVGDAVALWSRASRCRRAWAPHEERCRAAVMASVSGLAQHRTAVILGSGLLRDVPFEALAAAFDRVVLVDAVHLLPARMAARRHGAELLVADLAGGRSAGTPDPLAALKADPTVDLVVSANCLSQLAMAPLRRLGEEEETAVALARAIITRHLADLAAFPGRCCLMSDVAYSDVDHAGRVLDRTDLLHGMPMLAPDAAWDWEVAPAGEIDRGFARIHRVHVWRDFRQEDFRATPG